MWKLVIITSGIFIVDHACETMHITCKTGALLRKFAFRVNRNTCWPTVAQWAEIEDQEDLTNLVYNVNKTFQFKRGQRLCVSNLSVILSIMVKF